MKTSAGKVFRAVVGRLFKGRDFPLSFPIPLAVILFSAPDSALHSACSSSLVLSSPRMNPHPVCTTDI